jgi:rhamnose utilization protein RhaD (predicted bifunctional aldolase and dehydrogenase)
MVRAARTRLLDPSAPNPSVETAAARIPAAPLHRPLARRRDPRAGRSADDARRSAARSTATRLAIVPYVMPGFALAKLAAEVLRGGTRTSRGCCCSARPVHLRRDRPRVVRAPHRAVADAERYIASRASLALTASPSAPSGAEVDYTRLAPILRGELAADGGARHCVLDGCAPRDIRDFVDDPDLDSLATRGPATPDHVLRTKPLPLILRIGQWSRQRTMRHCADEVAARRWRSTARRTTQYFRRQTRAKQRRAHAAGPVDPRVILVPGLGLIDRGPRRARRAPRRTSTSTRWTSSASAEALGRYAPLAPRATSSTWSTGRWSRPSWQGRRERPLECPRRLRHRRGVRHRRGRRAALRRRWRAPFPRRPRSRVAGVAAGAGCRRTPSSMSRTGSAVARSIDAAVRRFGGIDGTVSNAGIAPQGPLRDCPPDVLDAVPRRQPLRPPVGRKQRPSASCAAQGTRRVPAVQCVEGTPRPRSRFRRLCRRQGRASSPSCASTPSRRAPPASAPAPSTPTASGPDCSHRRTCRDAPPHADSPSTSTIAPICSAARSRRTTWPSAFLNLALRRKHDGRDAHRGWGNMRLRRDSPFWPRRN